MLKEHLFPPHRIVGEQFFINRLTDWNCCTSSCVEWVELGEVSTSSRRGRRWCIQINKADSSRKLWEQDQAPHRSDISRLEGTSCHPRYSHEGSVGQVFLLGRQRWGVPLICLRMHYVTWTAQQNLKFYLFAKDWAFPAFLSLVMVTGMTWNEMNSSEFWLCYTYFSTTSFHGLLISLAAPAFSLSFSRKQVCHLLNSQPNCFWPPFDSAGHSIFCFISS